MKKLLFVTTLLGGIASGVAANAQLLGGPADGIGAGSLVVHLNALGVFPSDSSSNIRGVAGASVNATDAYIPELDISYYLSPNVAAALILGTSNHTLSANVNGARLTDVGSVWALPPTLTVQYHFLPTEAINPYVGVGVNGTLWYGEDAVTTEIGGKRVISKFDVGPSWGPALQAGFDWHITGNWYANVDVKYVLMDVAATVDSPALGAYGLKAHLALNPWLVGVGVGYKF